MRRAHGPDAHSRPTAEGLVLVGVNLLDALFVDVGMGVRLTVVRMLVLVLDMLVVVRRVRVHVRLAIVLVLVDVNGFLGVFVVHRAPVMAWIFAGGTGRGISGTPAVRCSM